MAKFYLSVLLFRFVLPASVLMSIALRPFGVSLLYLLLYLWLPFLPLPTAKTFGGVSGKALLLGTVLSCMGLLAHPVWHVTLVALPPYGSALGEACSWPARIAQNLGFVPFVNIPWRTAVRLTIPEIIMTVSTLFIYIVEKKICSKPSVESKGPSKYQQYPFLTNAGKYIGLFLIMFSGVLRPSVTSGIYFVVFIGLATWWSCGKELDKVLAVVGRCVVGIMAVHLLLLMAYQCSWIVELLPEKSQYARYFGLTRISVIACDTKPTMDFAQNVEWATFVSPLVIAITYYVLVLESSELLKPKPKKKPKGLSRLEGGVGVVVGVRGRSNGSLLHSSMSLRRAARTARAKDKWKAATSKVRVSNLYEKKQPAVKPTETTPLIRGLSPSKRSKKWSARTIHQDSTGSVMMPEEDSGEEAEESGLVDHLVLAIIGFFHVLIRSSYILTTIIMMAWSIMFHSWLTFILLIWGNLVWLVPNQRAFMLRTSPVLVAYAVFLLISQYVYGMDLLETELPSKVVDGVNLAQIGLERPVELPCIPLLIKSMMTVMFWVTLRQRNQESRQRRQSSTLADMAAPLQVTVGTAASVLEEQYSVQESPLLVKCGEWLRWFCTWYWIYVVVIMLFAIGITGERMTIFRIVYMFMFLYFILLFQISWKWWRKLMYAFWVSLIIYSMINLVLVYIYQFDNFAENIETHVGISMKFQTDLGLEKFKTSELFVRLVTPTFFLVITVIQLHYFHKDFLENSKLKSRGSSLGREDSVLPSQSAMSTQRDDLPGLSSSEEMNDEPLTEPRMSLPNDDTLPHASLRNDDTLPPASLPHDDADRRTARHTASLKRRLYKKLAIQTPEREGHTLISYTEKSSLNFKEYFQSTYEELKAFWFKATNLVFLYLEIHLIKIVFLSLMLLCVFDVCGLHVPIMLVISPVLLLDLRKQRVCVLLISTLISAYFMAKMIFQLNYIENETFDVNCTSSTNTTNNAKWMGFLKASRPDKPLPTILKGYIGMLAVFTAHSIVSYRQQNSASVGITIPGSREKIMFPGVTRQHADLDCVHCLKYLFNYGFYKFGVEVTLMCLIGVIGSRMDVYGLLYAGWLCALVCVDRSKQAQLWGCFTWSVALLVPLQYILAVGVLPQFCLEYPWGVNDDWGNYRRWFFLPYAQIPPPATKIVFDYFLLLFAARQRSVFRSERRRGAEHPGGSNSEDAGHLWETPDFVNPVPDFLTYVDSWLDVIKRIVFMGMLWVTLAIMFLTGTNRVNLFSMGYLIGSFVFLWQGTDLFLRPKKAILTWWSWLLRFNVGVIVIKTVFQIPGCLFGEVLQSNACWLVQLLGVGCVDKFMGGKFALRQTSNINDHVCSVPQEDIGLAWDGVCFAFLLLHRRLFHSYYFYRIIDESKATTILASRGAELIEELRDKQMKAQEEQEAKILDKIKVKMERIKANQKKIQGPMFKAEFPHHSADEDAEEERESSLKAPLERGDSDVSDSRGYHTPDATSPRGFHTPISDGSPVRLAPPSPSSALMTVSLDAYLEPQRISFGSPPASELLGGGRVPSPEESFPVFSPPPPRRRYTLPAWRAECPPRRMSALSTTSREPTSHHTSIRSGDYYMFDLFDETDILTPEDESSSDEDAPRKLGVGELLSNVMKTDLRRAVSLRRASTPAPSRAASRPSSLRSEPLNTRGIHYSEVDTGSVDLFPREADASTPLPDEQDTLFLKIRAYILFAWAFIESILISMTRFLKKYSRDYRYVSRVLSSEKKLLKEREGFGIGIRTGRKMIWTPAPDTNVKNISDVMMKSDFLGKQSRKLSELSVPEIRILAPSMERGLDLDDPDTPEASPQHLVHPSYEHRQSSVYSIRSNDSKEETSMEDQEDQFHQDKSPVVHFLLAIWYAVLSHTDIVCYLMVFINQIQSATILSIPLPLMVFLWGSLTIPRPSKTFWVTLIAYTEVIVLIKSMFQFEILPWNQQAVPAGMPFTAPRIIGIERKFNYAFYDLLLLLVIFFHRYMLKSLGLWKSSKIESLKEMRSDAYYQMQPLDAAMIQQGDGEAVGRSYAEKHLAADKSSIKGSINESEATSSKWTEQTLHRVPEVETHAEDDHHIPSTSFQVDTVDKNNDHMPMMIGVTTEEEAPVNGFPKYVGLAWQRYVQPVHKFYADMLDPAARVTADVYAPMFMCDFFNFLVVIFGFAAFGTQQGDGGVKAYLEENKVPIPFLIMLILQFGLIIIDRALYLRKYILGKILFQIILIVGVHIWMFFVLPFITERTFNNMLPPPMWYMVKCIYLLLSAYQIRCGYPNRIHGNFLCKGYGYVNMFLFRGFMLVPFVFELRALMDWIWTDTSMTLMDWLKMEDIFSNVFLLKCSRSVEDEFPQPRGSKKKLWSKYMMGGTALACIIALIWFPLVIFAFGNTVGVSNPPYDVTVKLRLGEFSPVYTMSVQKNNIRVFSPSDFDTLSNVYRKDRAAQTFLANYVYDDVAAVSLSSNSSNTWHISPPELQRLEKLITSNSSLTVRLSYVISHTTNNKDNPPLIEDEQKVVMPDFVDGKPNPELRALADVLDGNSADRSLITVKLLFPKFLKVFNKGLAKPVNQLMDAVDADGDSRMFRNVHLQLHNEGGTVWWQVQEDCDDDNYKNQLSKIPLNDCDNLVMYTFNDKLFPDTLNFISGSGIIGLYTTFVFVASRVLRSFFNGICFKIMFEDLPNVDRVLQLCLDIYLVREAAELVLEEDLFAKLVFLYRSPETMIKWTRPDEPDEEASRAIEAPQAPAQG